jgi:coenzyme F420 hydrogenase subunit delta
MQLLTPEDIVPEFCRKRVLILGCGNILFGDDGFGPAVVERLHADYSGRIPDDICILDAGSGARNFLFTLTLSERRPERVVIVDALDAGRAPGELFTLEIDELPLRKIDDFSMHQLPTSNLLKELKTLRGVDVRIVSCQVDRIPDSVSPGLSDILQRAVPKACEMILEGLEGYA